MRNRATDITPLTRWLALASQPGSRTLCHAVHRRCRKSVSALQFGVGHPPSPFRQIPVNSRLADLLSAHDALGEPLMVVDASGTVLERNRSARALFGEIATLPNALRPPFDGALTSASSDEVRIGEGADARVLAGAFFRTPDGSGWLWRASDVTVWASRAQQQATEACATSDARLRGVLESGFDAFAIVKAIRAEDGRIEDFRILDANRRAAELASTSRDALIGASLFEAFPRSREWGLWELCSRVVITREPLEATQLAPTPDEPPRWLQRQIVPLDADCVAISSRDVTERHLERLALEASEARHRQLFENNGAIQLVADVDTAAIVDANPAAESFYGWPCAILTTMFVTDLEAIAIEHWQALTASVPVGRGLHVQREHRIASGETRQVEAFIDVAYVGQRRVLHFIIHDISARMLAERQLRESEARFRAVIAGMREGVVLHDESGAIRVANPSAERILGLTTPQLMGQKPIDRDWQAIHEDGTLWAPQDHPAMVALRSGVSQPRQVMGLRRGDDVFAWLSITADPLTRPGEKRPYASVAMFTDVTDERASEDRLRQAQKLEAVAQLAGGIAHDFNNLLTVIRGATMFLRDGLSHDATQLEDVAAIERATTRAEELTRRLLAVGRRQLLRSEPVELGAMIREQAPIMRQELPLTIALKLELSPTPVIASVDRTRLLDAMRALLDNARSAMPNGGTLTVSTRLENVVHPHDAKEGRRPRSFAVLSMVDTGEGMREEIRARLFEPFFSTQPFGSNRGMGLASVHGMVHQIRGFIECDSAPGEGTAIRLYLPAAGTPPVGAPTIATDSADARTGGILLVDDDHMLRDLGRRMLEKLGEVVYVAASGNEALEFLSARASDVSLLITDLTMPGMSGLDLIDAVKERYAALPVAAISGYVVDPDARARLDSRGVPFLPKPFAVPDLARLVANARG